MNDGTYEGILNQDDVQEYFNGDDARPFYPERAETVIRQRTHYDGCYRVHPECALVKVAELERERNAARQELENAKEVGRMWYEDICEIKRALAEVGYPTLNIEDAAESVRRLGQERHTAIDNMHENADIADEFICLFKKANAAKRQMRRERDAAHQSRNRIVWLVRRYCALNQMNLAFFLDSEKLLRDARINLDAANKRAEQAEAELVEAQSRLIAGAVYEKLDSVKYWKARALAIDKR